MGSPTLAFFNVHLLWMVSIRFRPPPIKNKTRSITTAGFIIGADSASRKYELSKYSLGSGTKLEKISHEQQRLEEEAGISSSSSRGREVAEVGTKDALLNWAKQNRWSVVFGSWVASMAGSGAYIAASPLSFAQKLVQVRLHAPS